MIRRADLKGLVVVLLLLSIVSALPAAFAAPADPVPDPKIVQLAEQFVPALESGDVARNLAFYADDGIIAGYSGHNLYSGRTEIEAFLTQFFGDYRATDCSLKVLSTEQLGDWAELRAEFKATWQPKKEGLDPEVESSRYVWALQRQSDDSWKIARFLFYPNGKSL